MIILSKEELEQLHAELDHAGMNIEGGQRLRAHGNLNNIRELLQHKEQESIWARVPGGVDG